MAPRDTMFAWNVSMFIRESYDRQQRFRSEIFTKAAMPRKSNKDGDKRNALPPIAPSCPIRATDYRACIAPKPILNTFDNSWKSPIARNGAEWKRQTRGSIGIKRRKPIGILSLSSLIKSLCLYWPIYRNSLLRGDFHLWNFFPNNPAKFSSRGLNEHKRMSFKAWRNEWIDGQCPQEIEHRVVIRASFFDQPESISFRSFIKIDSMRIV